jgi:pseudouridine synthase
LYLMLNKPFGYICSMSDPQGRPLVTSLLKDVPQRLYSVGRLDFDSMGLLLLTNDGEWAHRLMHPRYRIPRTYKATVEGSVGESELDQLRRGVMLSDGPTLPARVAVLKKTEGRCQIRITIRQGRSRQVRRMLEAVGYPLIHLIRIGFGSLVLGNLKVGEYRALELEELDELNRSITNRPGTRLRTPSKKPAASASLPPIRKSKIENRK